MNDTQRQIARKLVELLLEPGYMLSLWGGTWYTLCNSTNIDDVLAAVEQLDGFVSIEIDLIHQAGQHEPYLGKIDLAYPTTQPSIGITYDVKPAIEPAIESIVDQIKDFADSLLAEEAA